MAGATLLSLLFAQHLFTRQSELYSEILCWTLLPIFLKVNTSSDTDNKATSTYTDVRRIPSIVLWLIAGSLTIVCVYKAENGIVELQVSITHLDSTRYFDFMADSSKPLLTPLLLVVQNWRRWEFSVSNKSRSRLLSPLFWGTTLCAFIAVLAVFRGNHLGAALSILAVTPQLFVYSALLPKDAPVSRLFPVVESFEDDLERLCWRAVASLTVALCVRTSVIGLTRFEFTHALSSGVIKAVTWLFVFRMVCSYTNDGLQRVLIHLSEATYVVVHCTITGNVQSHRLHRSILAVVRNSSCLQCSSFGYCTRTIYPHAAKAVKGENGSLAVFAYVDRPVLGGRPSNQGGTTSDATKFRGHSRASRGDFV